MNFNFKTLSFRVMLLLVALEICFLALLIRLIYIQVFRRNESLSALGQQRKGVERLRINRGKIYDRNFKDLAVNVSMVSIYADPKLTQFSKLSTSKRESEIVEIVSEALALSEREILRKFESKKRFVWVKRKVDYDVALKLKGQLEAERIKGIDFVSDEKRLYPKGKLGCHVIGFVGADNVGLEGIEKFYDSQIASEVKDFPIQQDGKRRRISFNYVNDLEEAKSLVLTIDETMQQIVEYELEAACKKWSAKSGSVIVMNPKSGEVLAMANYPNYDLNRFYDSDFQAMRNRAITDAYEPGSAFKIIPASAVIEEKVVSADTKIFCEEGEYHYEGKVIHDTHKSGWLSFREVMSESSNIGFVKISQLLGKDKLYKHIKAFGIGEKTNVDLLAEASGYMPPLKMWTPLTTASISFGQGISVTPLQMLCALNSIANRGLMMKPFVLKEIVNSKKNSLKVFKPTPIRRAISDSTASTLTDILVHVVENGSGKAAQLKEYKEYKVAGKTGTAQKAYPKDGKGGYLPGKYISSFVGFFPADDKNDKDATQFPKIPKISLIVIIDEPKGEYFSSKVAAPTFKKIAEGIIQYLFQQSAISKK